MDDSAAPMDPLRLTLADLAAALRGHEWFVFGAQAVRVWGIPRQTIDIDVTVALAPAEVGELVPVLLEHGLRPRAADPTAFAARYWVLPLEHHSGVPVDVVLAGTAFERDALARKRREMLHGVEVPIVSPEDLVVYKLTSERAKDEEDAGAVIRRQASTLDVELVRAYLRAAERAQDRSDIVASFDRLLASARRGLKVGE